MKNNNIRELFEQFHKKHISIFPKFRCSNEMTKYSDIIEYFENNNEYPKGVLNNFITTEVRKYKNPRSRQNRA